MKHKEHLHLDIQLSKSKETIWLQKRGHFQKHTKSTSILAM